MKRTSTLKAIPVFSRWTRKNFGIFASLHREVHIGMLWVGMSIVLLEAQHASAQSSDTLLVGRKIDPVGVYGEKTSPTRSVMAQTPVFDRSTAAAAPFQTLESALRVAPSVDVRERGGKAVQTDISIRGGSFDQTQVMLNGINFTDARTGHQTHSLPIDIESLSAIELLDGVQGVGAYAGAINFRTAPLYARYLRLDATGGQHGYGYSNLSGAYTAGRVTLYAAGSYRRSDGYTANTEFENWNSYVRATVDGGKIGFFDFQAGYQWRDFAANGFYSLKYPDQFEHTATGLGSLRWLGTFGRVETSASVSYRNNTDRFELVKGAPQTVPFNYHLTDNVGAEVWLSLDWVAGKTTLGGDYTWNQILSTVLGDELAKPVDGKGDIVYTHGKTRSVGNFWLRHAKRIGRWGVSLSGGVSTHPYGTTGSGSGEVSYRPAEGLKLYAGIVQSMRLPTFTDLYYTAKGYVSNRGLVPEKALMYRLGADYTHGKWGVSAVGYIRHGRDLIDWVRESADDDWHSLQLTRMTTYGVELSGGYTSSDGFLRRATLAYAYIATDKNSGEWISKYALDYMHNKLAAAVSVHLLRRVDFALNATLYDRAGNYTDRDGVTAAYKPYVLLDGRLSWSKGKVRIYCDATNITSTRYFDYGGLRMPDIWVNAGITLTIH